MLYVCSSIKVMLCPSYSTPQFYYDRAILYHSYALLVYYSTANIMPFGQSKVMPRLYNAKVILSILRLFCATGFEMPKLHYAIVMISHNYALS